MDGGKSYEGAGEEVYTGQGREVENSEEVAGDGEECSKGGMGEMEGGGIETEIIGNS